MRILLIDCHRRECRVLSALVAAASGLLLFSPSGEAMAQPRQQEVRGADRICVYRVNNEDRSMRVGRGEPCPRRYRPPPPAASPVPMLATLRGQRLTPQGLECTYIYNQRTYPVLVQRAGTCPYTPHFASPGQ